MEINNPVISLSSGLIGLFSSSTVNIRSIIKDQILDNSKQVLIVDPNHRWISAQLHSSTNIFQPRSRNEFLSTVKDLISYLNPRLDSVFVDDLPLYFRDYYGRDKLYTQNMRAITATFAFLKKVASHIRVVFLTYQNTLSPTEPIFFNQTQYYADAIYELKIINGQTTYYPIKVSS